MKEIEIMRLKGQDIVPFIPALAKLRISVFKSYPYLYDGNLEYEYKYLDTYVQCAESTLIVALHAEKPVGMSSAIPLAFETTDFQKPFLENNLPVKDIFYFGESVLLPAYRGHGVYRHFFTEREAAARKYGAKIAAFAAIERPADDPKKPNDYVPLNEVWQHFGYEKHLELCAYFKWKEVGATEQTPKPLIFWLKQL